MAARCLICFAWLLLTAGAPTLASPRDDATRSASPSPARTHAAPAPAHTDWAEVEQIAPDEAIAVLEQGRSQPTYCRMDQADDTTLACVLESRFVPSRRVVLPRKSVAAVYRVEIFFGPSNRGLLIGGGIGGLLGGLAGSSGSVGTGFAGAAFGALVGVGFAAAPRPFPIPNRRLHLVYRAP